jgi:integrase
LSNILTSRGVTVASIKIRNGRYTAVVRSKGHPTVSKAFSTESSAKRWATIEVDIERGESFSAEKHTLAEVIELYQDSPKVRLDSYDQTNLKWWKKEPGSHEINRLKRDQFVVSQAKLAKMERSRGEGTLAPATVNRRMARISAVLTYAEKTLGWLKSNPAQIEALEEHNERADEEALLDDEQLKSLLDACQTSEESSGADAPRPDDFQFLDIERFFSLARHVV